MNNVIANIYERETKKCAYDNSGIDPVATIGYIKWLEKFAIKQLLRDKSKALGLRRYYEELRSYYEQN